MKEKIPYQLVWAGAAISSMFIYQVWIAFVLLVGLAGVIFHFFI